MKLIVGFGNPGSEYNFTRHNFGFLSLDFYAKIHSLTWQYSPKFTGELAKSSEYILFKPQNFYNLSGPAVLKLLNFYKIPTENLLIINDDFDLPFGQIRFRAQGSSGGNNGLKSLIQALGHQNFPRLRLGINQPELRSKSGDSNFVLGRFNLDEKSKLPEILREVSQRIDQFLSN